LKSKQGNQKSKWKKRKRKLDVDTNGKRKESVTGAVGEEQYPTW
jgi:hypothetical protein